MRSNIPRTSSANCSESRSGTPLPASVSDETVTQPRLLRSPLVQRGEVGGERVLLLGRQARVRGHDPRADLEGPRDRVPRDARADLRQLRPGAVVAVVPELVAGEAAG